MKLWIKALVAFCIFLRFLLDATRNFPSISHVIVLGYFMHTHGFTTHIYNFISFFCGSNLITYFWLTLVDTIFLKCCTRVSLRWDAIFRNFQGHSPLRGQRSTLRTSLKYFRNKLNISEAGNTNVPKWLQQRYKFSIKSHFLKFNIRKNLTILFGIYFKYWFL